MGACTKACTSAGMAAPRSAVVGVGDTTLTSVTPSAWVSSTRCRRASQRGTKPMATPITTRIPRIQRMRRRLTAATGGADTTGVEGEGFMAGRKVESGQSLFDDALD